VVRLDIRKLSPGGSFSTPALFEGTRGEFAASEFVLVGRSSEPLEYVAQAWRLLAGEAAPQITPRVCAAATSAAALEGATVVLLQMRIGNLRGREFDESFPAVWSVRGRGTGSGRGVGCLAIVAHDRDVAAGHPPRAVVLIMTSPVGILTRAAQRVFPDLNCLGICEVPYLALRDMAAQLAVDLASMSFDYLGVNHLGWLYAVRSQGRDLVREWADLPNRRGFPSRRIILEWGGIPTKYLRLHFEADAVLASQRAMTRSRAAELEGIRSDALAGYATASEPELRLLMSRRETPWYSESILPLLRGMLHGECTRPLFLSGPNRVFSAVCAEDDILEMGCRVERGAITRIPKSRPPPRIAELVSRFCRHERAATDAVLERHPPLLEAALSAHPWVARATPSPGRLPALLAEAIIAGNA
jgi:6-phospho-beta-glucosidase